MVAVLVFLGLVFTMSLRASPAAPTPRGRTLLVLSAVLTVALFSHRVA